MKLFAVIIKELQLLKRDRGGLLVLFLMPAFLVVVITLVQENVMELTGQKKTQVAFLDRDQGTLGPLLKQHLSSYHLQLVEWESFGPQGVEELKSAVERGDFQLGILLPQGSSVLLSQVENQSLFLKATEDVKEGKPQIPVRIFFDPGTLPGLRSGLTAQVEMALTRLASQATVEQLDRDIKTMLAMLPQTAPSLQVNNLAQALEQPLFVLDVALGPGQQKGQPPYNPVQQNVPAWALFGMFFTAIPIAGSILEERKSGVWARLLSLPVPTLSLFTGKVLAYIGICFCQFLLTALIGYFLFPYLGLPAFTLLPKVMPVLVVIFFTSLAACGYGIFLGIACNSYEQASTLGSTSVVTAAAMGGVMVPVYAMPKLMQDLSMLSPLNWGLSAFNDLLMRGFSFSAIVDDLVKLLLFFLLTLLLAWQLAQQRI